MIDTRNVNDKGGKDYNVNRGNSSETRVGLWDSERQLK